MNERLAADELEHFKRWGFVALRGVVDPSAVEETQNAVRRHLAKQEVYVNGEYQLDARPRTAQVLAHADLVKGLKRNKHINAMITEEVIGYCRQIFAAFTGDTVEEATTFHQNAQLLFTWPNATAWSIPSTIWHLDFPRVPGDGFVGAQVFGFVEEVAPGGGGTLIAAGSHHLLNEDRLIKSKVIKKRLKKKPGYAELLGKDESIDRPRFLEPFEVDGFTQRVVELTGKPGDIYLTDLRLLHTLAPNASLNPRIMLTKRFVRQSAMDQFMESIAKTAA